MMDVSVAFYIDSDGDNFKLIGVSRTSEGAKTLAERWAYQNGIKPTYATWTIDHDGDWTLYELFVRQFYLPDGVAP
jgi:hypothetical protein